MEDCEIEMNESCAGTHFALKRGDKLIVGKDIDPKEAAAWVEGRRARVLRGDLPGVKGNGPTAAAMIGTPAQKVDTDDTETIVRRGRKGQLA